MDRRGECLALASVWAVWALIILLGFCWLLFAVLHFFGVLPKAADWVQAIGSIVAIIAAGTFPLMHERVKEYRAGKRARTILLLLLYNQKIEIEKLINVLSDAVVTQGETIECYQKDSSALTWAPHMEALRAISMADLDPEHVDMLGQMKVAAAYVQVVIGQLKEWDGFSDEAKTVINCLELFRDSCQDFIVRFRPN